MAFGNSRMPFKDWKKCFCFGIAFTIGHTLALLLSVYGMVQIQASLVEFLIPITILITAIFISFTAGNRPKNESITFCHCNVVFRIIHGGTRIFKLLQKRFYQEGFGYCCLSYWNSH